MERIIAETDVYNTETGEGNSEVIKSLQKSFLTMSLKILKSDKRNGPARRMARWAVGPVTKNPDFPSLTSVARQNGNSTYHIIF